MMNEYTQLIATQLVLEKEMNDKVSFIGLSVNDTIRKCLTSGLSKRADKLKGDWKVPDKRCVRS